jgi:hypothetical protein
LFHGPDTLSLLNWVSYPSISLTSLQRKNNKYKWDTTPHYLEILWARLPNIVFKWAGLPNIVSKWARCPLRIILPSGIFNRTEFTHQNIQLLMAQKLPIRILIYTYAWDRIYPILISTNFMYGTGCPLCIMFNLKNGTEFAHQYILSYLYMGLNFPINAI